MKKSVEFFFDYASPYSYLADYQLSSFRNIEIIYRPMLLGAVMQATNNKPPGTIPSKGNYIAKDLELWSQHYGIPFRMNSIFVHNLDLSDVDILKNLINQQQLNSDQLIEKLSENTIKDELKRNTNEAISRGAFGAPTFFINDEMFFGNDRLDFIKAKLL